MSKRITVFTATRAEYHLLYSVIKKIDADTDLDLDLIVSGTHLSHKYGYTVDQIISDGFKISKEIPIIDEEQETDIDVAISKVLLGCSEHFKHVKSDFLIILGDRYELLGAVIAATNALIPIAHIHGGETTEGAIDEAIRHAVTKFSYLHFTCCEPYRKRVIQLGEDPKRVFNVGALGVENILNQLLMSRTELSQNLEFDLNKFGLVTFHPVTLENATSEEQVKELLNALLSFNDMTFVITKANADNGGEKINNILDEYGNLYKDKLKIVSSLGMMRYLSAMKYCELVIGNSSSGILEAPSFKVPTINIGDRQRGRIQAESIINCTPIKESIINAMNRGLDSTFRKSIKDMLPLYGTGNASTEIIKVIKEFLEKPIDLKKKFFDI